MSQKPTLHDQVVNLLEQTVNSCEHHGVQVPGCALVARPVIKRIRQEQAYDKEVLALLDRLEALLRSGDK